MRICCYTSTALPKIGGQELVVDTLARRFCRAGHEVVVLAPRPHPRVLAAAEAAMQCSPLPLGEGESPPYLMAWHPRFRSTRWFVAWYRHWLARLHRRHRFDVAHCHDVYPTGYVAARCAAIAGVPLVVTSHGVDLDSASLLMRKPQLHARYVTALRRADAAIAGTEALRQRFYEVCPAVRQVELIPNGVDLARFAAVVPRPPRLPAAIRPGQFLLYLGRLVHRKGVDLLIEGFRHAAAGNAVGLVIAGEGPERAALEAQASAAGLPQGRVWFLGRTDELTKTWLVQHALCCVLPSRIAEAFPLSVLEAHAAGRPVIGTRVPGLESLVKAERTGLLAAPESPTALGEAIAQVIRDRPLLDRMGRTAQQAAQTYDWDRIADRHVALYQELIGRRGQRAA
jgi:glycosyltransferase involved in cell wall biosynthesis